MYVIWERCVYFVSFSVDTGSSKLTAGQDEINNINYKLIMDNKQLGEEQEIESKYV